MIKPHIIFRDGHWQLREVRQFMLFGNGGQYYKLAAPAELWCRKQNARL